MLRTSPTTLPNRRAFGLLVLQTLRGRIRQTTCAGKPRYMAPLSRVLPEMRRDRSIVSREYL